MKLCLALRELHRSERALAAKLDAIAARHHSDHAIRYVAVAQGAQAASDER
jgi:hypothetical protein